MYELSWKDRIRLRRTLIASAVKSWWYTPGARFELPSEDLARLLGALRREVIVDQALRSFARLAFPAFGDAAALAVEGGTPEARSWVEQSFGRGPRRAFKHADSVMEGLQAIVEDLMCQPVAVRRILWREDGAFRVLSLLPEGVEPLRAGGYRVHTPAAQSWLPEDYPPEHDDLDAADIVVFERPPVLGDGVPLVRAFPHLLNSRLEDHAMVERLRARTFPEDTSVRAHATRRRPFALPARALNDSRVARILNGSLLELHNMAGGIAGSLGLDEQAQYAAVTEHYLVWQHREALRTAGAVREAVLDAASRDLFAQCAERAGLEATGLRLRPRGAPTPQELDAAFEDYLADRVDVFAYHERIRWT
jgi:hypothetical protein